MLARPAPGYPLFRGMMPGWDNTPRVQDRAHCFVNAEPANYARWLQAVVRQTRVPVRRRAHCLHQRVERWGEGCHLEPDARYGRAFREATALALKNS